VSALGWVVLRAATARSGRVIASTAVTSRTDSVGAFTVGSIYAAERTAGCDAAG